MDSFCLYCGKEFCGRAGQRFCSKECRTKAYNKSRPKPPSRAIHEERICPHCGGKFISSHNGQRFCSKKCSSHHSEQQKHNKRQTDINAEALNKIVDTLNGAGFDYVSGYETEKSIILIKCKKCGTTREYCADSVRNIRKKGFQVKCKTCLEAERRAKIEKQKAEREREKFIKTCKPLEYAVLMFCPECGEPFESKCEGDVCSKCKKRAINRRKDKRVPKELRNRNLTWRTLWDKGDRKCALCGGECNPNDYVVREDGTIIVGDTFPSLDHIIPVFKGGGDTIDNVQLAHCRCNTLRGVKDWKEHREMLRRAI